MKISNRMGQISVTFALLESEKGREDLSSAFSGINFIPLQITTDYSVNQFKYVGTSPEFSEVPEGAECQKYNLSSITIDKKTVYEAKIA